MGAKSETLVDTYQKQVRTILEYCVPVWHSRLTLSQSNQLERVQNVSMRVIMGQKYTSSRDARNILNLKTLYKRRVDICLKGDDFRQHEGDKNGIFVNYSLFSGYGCSYEI